VYANPAARAIYVAAAKPLGRQPFRLAVSDFLSGRTRATVAITIAHQEAPEEAVSCQLRRPRLRDLRKKKDQMGDIGAGVPVVVARTAESSLPALRKEWR
jgi:hypothetical protein